MNRVVGNIKSLRAGERIALEKLIRKSVVPHEIIGIELVKRAAKITSEIGLLLAFLIGRDGNIEYLIVGTKNRMYLPDLGRFRLDRTRLRGLRLIIFYPEGAVNFGYNISDPIIYGGLRSKSERKREILSPIISADLLTDLEKLRLDALLVTAVSENGSPGPVALAYLDPSGDVKQSIGSERFSRSIRTHYFNDYFEIEADFLVFIEDLQKLIEHNRHRGYDTAKEHAVLVGAYTGTAKEAEASMQELEELAITAGIQVLDKIVQRRRALDPRTVIGKGKIEEIVLHCLDLGAEMLIFDKELTPAQLRSITNLTELKIIDRSMLILDIFAQRAVSSEGRLQVELAQLKYSLPRLTEKDSGLSRLTGGIGGRGPGETKLEIGRRRVRDRITDLERKIDKLSSQRGVRRKRRQGRGVPVVAIVGYTNAGKSTLMNAITKGDVFVENKLFATLDPTSRRMRFPNDKEVIFVDTVGFIRELPAELVTAFRATLEEVGESDLLIHLVDATNPSLFQQIEIVKRTLDELGFSGKPALLVLNKVDLLSTVELKTLQVTLDAHTVSALKRNGIGELIARIQNMLNENFKGLDPGRFTELSGGSF